MRQEWVDQPNGTRVLYEWDETDFAPCRTFEGIGKDGIPYKVTACHNPLLRIVKVEK